MRRFSMLNETCQIWMLIIYVLFYFYLFILDSWEWKRKLGHISFLSHSHMLNMIYILVRSSALFMVRNSILKEKLICWVSIVAACVFGPDRSDLIQLSWLWTLCNNFHPNNAGIYANRLHSSIQFVERIIYLQTCVMHTPENWLLIILISLVRAPWISINDIYWSIKQLSISVNWDLSSCLIGCHCSANPSVSDSTSMTSIAHSSNSV